MLLVPADTSFAVVVVVVHRAQQAIVESYRLHSPVHTASHSTLAVLLVPAVAVEAGLVVVLRFPLFFNSRNLYSKCCISFAMIALCLFLRTRAVRALFDKHIILETFCLVLVYFFYCARVRKPEYLFDTMPKPLYNPSIIHELTTTVKVRRYRI